MAIKRPQKNRFIGGIANFDKEGQTDSYAFGRSVDVRTNPKKVGLLPKTSKESGNVVVDLPIWGERVIDDVYYYGNAGNVYKRTLVGSHSLLRTVPDSHGNGLAYFGEDGYLYYASDKVIGRYGPIGGTPTFTDDFLGSEGGVPTNTNSLQLLSASSQYAARADTASLSITSNIAMETYIKPTTLPTVGNTMTLIAKWDETGTTRSYKFDINAISGYFGDASDGNLTISSDTVDAPKDATCTGTISTQSLSFASSSGTFVNGEVIFIHQSQGTGAGTWMRNKITGVSGTTSGTLTLETPLNATYSTGAQVLVMKQYNNVTIDSTKTLTAKSWDGSKGGILAFLISGTLTNNGTIANNGVIGSFVTSSSGGAGGTNTVGGGFRGGAGHMDNSGVFSVANAGEGTVQAPIAINTPNGNGGGGASQTSGGRTFGGGGGNGVVGTGGIASGVSGTVGSGGNTAGSIDLTTMVFGGGGGGATKDSGGTNKAGDGGSGGGIIFLTATTITNAGGISCNGGGVLETFDAIAGCGAGGSVLLKVQNATLGSGLITANGGTNSTGGGNGGAGRVHIDFYTAYTGTSTPTIDATQDNSLVTTTSYQLRLGISSTGLNSEFLTKVVSLTTGAWQHVAVSWVASTSTATFFLNGVSLGTSTGTLTAIHNNASVFSIGANIVAVYANFFNGLMDDPRLWNTVRSEAQIFANKDIQLGGAETGLAAYYKLNAAYTDSTANTNNLTSAGTPVFVTDVPFAAPTTRRDIDQSDVQTGDTYALPTTITEASTDRQTFIPAKDPQKSIDFNIAAKGTGDWTVTIHDGLNRVISTVTVTNANLPASGFYEFVYSSVWRPVIGQTYHAHITSTVADGTLVSDVNNDMETASFHTYYQFLVTDGDYHPIARILNGIGIGNDRYLAFWDGSTYNPMRLVFPSGYRIRSIAKWNEYWAIGCWRGSNVYDYDQGIIFFWNGTSTTYDFFIDVPEGSINAMVGSAGTLYIWAGYQGDMLEYKGGPRANKVSRVPKISSSTYIDISPGAVNLWKTLLRYGAAVNSDSTEIERGVYSYGSLNNDYADCLTYDYPISTGNRTATNIKIGMVYPVDRKLLIGWQDNTAFGIDVVDASAMPFTTGTIEFLISDEGAPWKEKLINQVKAVFEPLESGESVTLKYRLNRDDGATWENSKTESTVGEKSMKLDIPTKKGRHYEYQVAIDLASSGSTSPQILGVVTEEDTLTQEQDL